MLGNEPSETGKSAPTSGSRRESLIQFIKFGLVGLMNTGVDYAVYSLLYWGGLHYLAAQGLGYAAGTVNSYYVNRGWTFRSGGVGGRDERRRMLRFLTLNGATLLLSIGLLYGVTEGLGIHPLLSKLVVTFATLIFNFIGSKIWVFK